MGDMSAIIGKKAGFIVTFFFIVLLALAMSSHEAMSMSNEDCLECHGDEDLTREADDSSVYVNAEVLAKSVHGDEECVSCHQDADAEDEHPPQLKRVNCEECHDEIGTIYEKSIHGKARGRGDALAPYCSSCHGTHDILPPNDPQSKVYVTNIPITCGRCHREGSPMTKTHEDIDQHNVLKNFSMSMHGKGLLKSGLIVAAVCTSCHTSHNVRPHTDPESTTNPKNIAKTCMHCHANIENTHRKVIRKSLWEKEPHKIPSCIECHQPHEQSKIGYQGKLSDAYCLKCHSNPNLVMPDEEGGVKSLYVDTDEYDEFKGTLHKINKIACVKCHSNMDSARDPVCRGSGPVDCSACHPQQSDVYAKSIHGKLLAELDPNAPGCTDCHGKHNNMSKANPDSPINPINIPNLCGACHRDGKKAAVRIKGGERKIVATYSMSIHGKGLVKSGLLVSATCASCHTGHSILPPADPESTVNRNHVSDTCESCHYGVARKIQQSIHNPPVGADTSRFPICSDCHSAHGAARVSGAIFRKQQASECAKCHEEQVETYRESYHGKASMLAGGERAAQCSDCHGSHTILAATDPDSTLAGLNAVKTCRKCHPGANLSFTTYRTHATHGDKKRNPDMYYAFWSMTSLLLGTFSLFGLHTLLWFPRSFKERMKMIRKAREQKK
ncbi:MAG: hypothetical protein DSY57_02890 [Desulfobulbus sp.]|nr:MAG: hypothetical protein DSY57_02890 [Desulfobulbus sp.]